MSVQAGIWNFEGAPVEREKLAKISRQVAEYGPDGEEVYVAGNVGMLYRPFHTTAESRAEHQPHRAANGKLITWDGRLDNRDYLIAQIGSPLNAQSTDVDIAAAAYEKWTYECFSKFVGEWSLALWDSKDQTLILARDYIGIKHLFYYPQPTGITWCSHLEPLVLCGDSFSLCEEYISNYLMLRLPSNLTPYRELHSVPAGGFVVLRQGSITRNRYWSFAAQRLRYKTDTEYEEHFRHLFRQAVRRRLRSQSCVLAELSGGLDSSSMVCMADEILANDRSAAPIATFSYNYADEIEGDDSHYIHIMEKRRGVPGISAVLHNTGDSLSLDHDNFVAVPTFGARREAEAARSKVVERGQYRVVLTGIGGDEFMGGALNARVQLADLLVQGRWIKFHKLLLSWATFWRYPYAKLLLEAIGVALPAPIRAKLNVHTWRVHPWIRSAFARKTNLSVMLLPAIEGSVFWLPTARDAYQTYRRMSGILTNFPPTLYEPRYPCLDQTLTEFLMSIPSDQLLRVGERRSLMRRALIGIVPNEILTRHTKQRDGGGYITTLAKRWKRVTFILNSPHISQLGYVEAPEFKAALAIVKRTGHLDIESMTLLRALFLELWLRGALKHEVLSPTGPLRSRKSEHRFAAELSVRT